MPPRQLGSANRLRIAFSQDAFDRFRDSFDGCLDGCEACVRETELRRTN